MRYTMSEQNETQTQDKTCVTNSEKEEEQIKKEEEEVKKDE